MFLELLLDPLHDCTVPEDMFTVTSNLSCLHIKVRKDTVNQIQALDSNSVTPDTRDVYTEYTGT